MSDIDLDEYEEGSVHRRVAERLNGLSLSMRGAANDAGLGETAVRDLLKNKQQSPRLKTLEMLAPILKTTVAWLATGKGSASADPELEKVKDFWSEKLDRESRKRVLDYTRFEANQSKERRAAEEKPTPFRHEKD